MCYTQWPIPGTNHDWGSFTVYHHHHHHHHHHPELKYIKFHKPLLGMASYWVWFKCLLTIVHLIHCSPFYLHMSNSFRYNLYPHMEYSNTFNTLAILKIVYLQNHGFRSKHALVLADLGYLHDLETSIYHNYVCIIP